jgi:hypothetical protein
MAKKIYIRNGVNLDSAITIPGYKSIGYNSDSDTSILSEKNGLGDITEIGGGPAYKVYTALLSQSGTSSIANYDNTGNMINDKKNLLILLCINLLKSKD